MDMDIDMNTDILSNPKMYIAKSNQIHKNIEQQSTIPEKSYIIRGDQYLQTVELGKKINTDVRMCSPQDYKLGTPIYLSKTAYTINLGQLSTTIDILEFRKLFQECCFRAGFHIETNYLNDLENKSRSDKKEYIPMRRTSETDDYLDLSTEMGDIYHHDKLVFTEEKSFKPCIVYVTYYIGVWKENPNSTNKTYVIDFQFINNSTQHIGKLLTKIQQQLTLKKYKNHDWKLFPYFDIKKNGIHCPLKEKELSIIAKLLSNSISINSRPEYY